MPTSADAGKPEAIAMVRQFCSPEAMTHVLDVGPGAGRWYDELAPILPNVEIWDAIEVHEPYVQRFNLMSRYDAVVIGDVRSVALRNLEDYDLAIFGDVLEHLPKQHAKRAVERLRWTWALLSIPMAGGAFEHQDECEGNPHEAHLASWTADDVRQTFNVVAEWVNPHIGVFLLQPPVAPGRPRVTAHDLVRRYWPTGDLPTFEHAVTLEDGGDVVCHVGLTERVILTGEGQQCRVAGIGYVCTAPDHQRRGLMHAAMEMAHARARAMGLPFALLNTGHVGLYEPLGYERNPNLPPEWMVACLGGASWPDGAIDLQGTW